MMQQPGQQDQIGSNNQQVSQQMMLCPVRLVYETQILVQPGDQIQPNQTIFLNQQNLPPWIQNRTVPNQVIYVQQMPSNNYVPAIQAPMDQSQMYVQQNFSNFPQIMPNMIMPQNSQEQRPPAQINNVLPHLLQNPQNNLVSNVANFPSERVISQQLSNYNSFTQNTGTNQSNGGQNIISVGPSNERQIVTNMQTIPQMFNPGAITYQKPHELQPVRHQNPVQKSIETQIINQQANLVRPQSIPQVMSVNPVQNIPNIQQRPPNMTQAIGTSIGHMLQHNNTIRTHSQPLAANPTNTVNTQTGMISNKIVVPTNINKTNNMQQILSSAMSKNYQQTYRPPYRPIQPRPQTYSNNPPMFLPREGNTQVNQTLGQMQNMTNIRESSPKQGISSNNSLYPVSHYVRNNDNNVQTNRKRKSESPDEIHKKVIINSASGTDKKFVIKQEIDTMTSNSNLTSGISVNTTPLLKVEDKLNIVPKPVETKSDVTEIVKLLNAVTKIPVTTVNESSKVEEVAQKSNNEKLVRNTVFTQARGRLLSDKLIENNSSLAVNAEIKNSIVETKVNPSESYKNHQETKHNACENKDGLNELGKLIMETKDKVKQMVPALENKIIADEIYKIKEEKQEALTTSVVETVKTENVILESKLREYNVEPEQELNSNLENIRDEKTERKNKILTIDDMRGKEICVIDGNVRKEARDNFLLTHVLDGYVIQESNVAFPIRRPLKEKTIINMQKGTGDQQSQDQISDLLNDRLGKEESIKDNSKIFKISDFHMDDVKVEEIKEKKVEEEDASKDNPFKNFKHDAVKKWTVNELAGHLVKYKWDDTISVLRDHEIDGDALFLVSKMQLVNIGVSENHADIICDFVKS